MLSPAIRHRQVLLALEEGPATASELVRRLNREAVNPWCPADLSSSQVYAKSRTKMCRQLHGLQKNGRVEREGKLWKLIPAHPRLTRD